MDTKAKCRNLKKFTCKETLRQVFICLRPLPLLGFCLRRSGNFVGSESCQKQSVKQHSWSKNRIFCPTQIKHDMKIGISYITERMRISWWCPLKRLFCPIRDSVHFTEGECLIHIWGDEVHTVYFLGRGECPPEPVVIKKMMGYEQLL